MKMSWNIIAIAAALGMTTVACSKKPEAKPAEKAAVKPAEPAKPEEKPAEPAKPEEKPAEPAKPEEKPAEPVAPEAKPAEPVAPEAKPAEPVAPEAKPAEAAAVGHAETIQAVLTAVTEKNYPAAIGAFADGVVWEAVGGKTETGKDTLEKNFTSGGALIPDMKMKASWIFDFGENAVATIATQGSVTMPGAEGAPAVTKSFSVEAAYIYHFDTAGKIDKVTEYFDSHKLDLQIAAAPAPAGAPAPVLAVWPETTQIIKGEPNEANATLVKGVIDAMKADTFEARFREALAPDFSMTDSNTGAPITGIDAAIDGMKKGLFAMLPDYSATATLVGATGDWAVYAVESKGTYKGGIPGVEAKDQPVAFKSLNLMKVENGKVRTYLNFYNSTEIGKALGLVPAAPEGEAKPAEGAAPAAPAEGAAPAAPAEGAAPAAPAEGAAPAGEAKPADPAVAPAAPAGEAK